MSRLTQDTNYYYNYYQYRDFTSYVLPFQVIPVLIIINIVGPTTPTLPKQYWFGLFPFRSPLLWESLFVFSSSGYLDVSVLRVCFTLSVIPGLQPGGLPHSDTCGYSGYLLLPAAFRSLSRPSSPLRAKAFTVCS